MDRRYYISAFKLRSLALFKKLTQSSTGTYVHLFSHIKFSFRITGVADEVSKQFREGERSGTSR